MFMKYGTMPMAAAMIHNACKIYRLRIPNFTQIYVKYIKVLEIIIIIIKPGFCLSWVPILSMNRNLQALEKKEDKKEKTISKVPKFTVHNPHEQ